MMAFRIHKYGKVYYRVNRILCIWSCYLKSKNTQNDETPVSQKNKRMCENKHGFVLVAGKSSWLCVKLIPVLHRKLLGTIFITSFALRVSGVDLQ